MKHLIQILFFISMAFSACNNDNIVNNTPDDHSPMWPMPGHDARNTSNINAQKTSINPITQGVLDWKYTFPQAYYSDGAEFCVDSKSNIYFLSQQESPYGYRLIKFRSDGTIIWEIDSLESSNYSSCALSTDEKTFYMTALKRTNGNYNYYLWAIDSSGIIKWSFPDVDFNKPVIGLNGTIIIRSNLGITALSSNGNLLWSNSNISFDFISEWAVDREGNIYTGGGSIRKFSKNGIYQWDFDPNNDVFFTKYIVIDGYNNIYFTDNSNDSNSGTRLFSLTKDGVLRWTKKTPYYNLAITSDNKIVTDGDSIRVFDINGNQIWARSSVQNGQGNGESVILDNQDNIYFMDDLNYSISAISKNGTYLWTCPHTQYGTLPKLSLMPNGRVLFAPKRAYEIFCIK